MDQADREQAIWYYQLGGQALGPVPWAEIEQVLADSADAEKLLVARGGDAKWVAASAIVAEIEAAEKEADAEADDRPELPAPPEPMTPAFGLRAWIGQAWQVVSSEFAGFFAAGVLLWVLGAFTLMICFPAIHAGMYVMALKRFRGEAIAGATVFEGFRHFWPTLFLYLLMGLLALPMGLLAVAAQLAILMLSERPAGLDGSGVVFWLGCAVGLALPLTVAFYAVPLIVDRKMGALEALSASWAVTRTDFASYLGMALVLSLLAWSGLLLCWFGLMFTIPLLPAAQVAAYRYHFRAPGEAVLS